MSNLTRKPGKNYIKERNQRHRRPRCQEAEPQTNIIKRQPKATSLGFGVALFATRAYLPAPVRDDVEVPQSWRSLQIEGRCRCRWRCKTKTEVALLRPAEARSARNWLA